MIIIEELKNIISKFSNFDIPIYFIGDFNNESSKDDLVTQAFSDLDKILVPENNLQSEKNSQPIRIIDSYIK